MKPLDQSPILFTAKPKGVTENSRDDYELMYGLQFPEESDKGKYGKVKSRTIRRDSKLLGEPEEL